MKMKTRLIDRELAKQITALFGREAESEIVRNYQCGKYTAELTRQILKPNGETVDLIAHFNFLPSELEGVLTYDKDGWNEYPTVTPRSYETGETFLICTQKEQGLARWFFDDAAEKGRFYVLSDGDLYPLDEESFAFKRIDIPFYLRS